MKPNHINTSRNEGHPIHSFYASPCGTSHNELRCSTFARFRFQAAGSTLLLAIFALYFGFTMKAKCQDPRVWMGFNYSGTKGVDGEVEESISDLIPYVEKPTGVYSHNVVFPPTNKGAAVHCRHGYLRASASGSIFHSRYGSQPEIWTDSGGNAQAGFSDNFAIRGAGNTTLPAEILVRMHWRVSGALVFINHTPPPLVTALGVASYHCQVLGMGESLYVSGSRGLGFGHDPNSGSLPNHSLVDEGTFLTEHPVAISIDADVSVSSATHGTPGSLSPEITRGEANAAVTLELLYIEVMDPATNRHLPVSVTAESGHSYPVVQPPVLGPGFGTTSFALNRDTGSGFVSFASPASGNFRVLGGNDFANMGSWQELAVVAGIPGVNAVNFNDPGSITQPSRFFVVQRLDD